MPRLDIWNRYSAFIELIYLYLFSPRWKTDICSSANVNKSCFFLCVFYSPRPTFFLWLQLCNFLTWINIKHMSNLCSNKQKKTDIKCFVQSEPWTCYLNPLSLFKNTNWVIYYGSNPEALLRQIYWCHWKYCHIESWKIWALLPTL